MNISDGMADMMKNYEADGIIPTLPKIEEFSIRELAIYRMALDVGFKRGQDSVISNLKSAIHRFAIGTLP